MSFEIRLMEGNHRGFLSNFITILTGYRALEKAGVDLDTVCVDPFNVYVVWQSKQLV